MLICYHESSRTPQHSKWNCVGANRPQHKHIFSHMVCVIELWTHLKIRIVQKKSFPQRRNSNSNLLINSKNTRNRSNWCSAPWYSSRPSNCWSGLRLTCCSGGIGLFPLPVTAVYSWQSHSHVCFASLKSLRWFNGPWIPSAFRESFQDFSFRLLSCYVATWEWSFNAISSYWMICSSAHPISDKDLRYLSSLFHLSRMFL